MRITAKLPRLILFGAVLACPASLRAGVVLTPTADTFLSAGPSPGFANSGNNYGAGGALSVAASGSAKGEFQSLMLFDSSTAKTQFDTTFGVANWTVQSVTLTLTATNPGNAIFNASAAGSFSVDWMQKTNWTEGTGTPALPTTDGASFNSLPSLTGAGDQTVGTFTFAGGTSGAATYTLTATSGLTTSLLSGSAISLRLYAADANVSYLFNSRTFGTASARPELTVNAVAAPEPSGLAIILALAGFGLLKRRRQR